MSLRRWISLVAMFSVLLHAGMIVRHNGVMLGAKLLHQELVSALGVICHNDGSTARLPASAIPDLPEPAGDQSQCPLCAGLSAVAILPAIGEHKHVTHKASCRAAITGERIAVRLTTVCPPSRGPPALV